MEIEDERKNNLLSIMVRELHLTRDWGDSVGCTPQVYFALVWSLCKYSAHAEKGASRRLHPAFSSLLQFKDPYESYLRQFSEDADPCGPFGLEYTFTLRETELNKNAVDEVPEWMLPLGALKVSVATQSDEKTAEISDDF